MDWSGPVLVVADSLAYSSCEESAMIVWQAVEKGRQLRSHIARTLNVRADVRLGFSLVAALPDDLFEQLAEGLGTLWEYLLEIPRLHRWGQSITKIPTKIQW